MFMYLKTYVLLYLLLSKNQNAEAEEDEKTTCKNLHNCGAHMVRDRMSDTDLNFYKISIVHFHNLSRKCSGFSLQFNKSCFNGLRFGENIYTNLIYIIQRFTTIILGALIQCIRIEKEQVRKDITCARNYRPSFRENKPKTLGFYYRKRAFWACSCENWVYKFGHWSHETRGLSNNLSLTRKPAHSASNHKRTARESNTES